MNQPTSSGVNRRPEFVTLIAVYQFVTAGILFLMSCLVPAIVFPAIFAYVDLSQGIFAALVAATGALALFLGFGFASVVVGWGLMRMREWARLGAIVLAAFALIGFPIWTIVAILVLVYMTSEDARNAFTAAAAGTERGDPRHHDALSARAVYKAEPPVRADASPLDDTRPMGKAGLGRMTREGPASPWPAEETRQIKPIPMPPSSDPAEATDTFYDDEADVSDHYRRWKASLQEPTQEIVLEETAGPPSEQPTIEMPAVEPEIPLPPPKRKWVLPPEEAGMDHRILRPREDDDEEKSR